MESTKPALAPHAPEAEKRHATVVKCDIVGSTGVMQSLDLDGQLAFKRGWEQLVTQVASRHAGHVERFEGDGALLTFGHPEGREDAAESAIRMGLELVENVRGATFVPGARLQVRVGIASGQIAVLKRPLVAKSESIAGVTIDMAERLRAGADPDQVVLSDATKRLAGGFFDYQDLGTLRLKGFEDGVRAWLAVRESSVVSRFEAQRARGSSGEIIGREEALEALACAWTDSLSGHGQAICLEGDAGMGKSRLARSMLDRAAQDGAVVVEIDCTPSTRNSPLFPIGVLLRRIARIPPQGTEEQKRTLAENLLSRFLPAERVPDALSYLAPLFGLDSLPVANANPTEVREHTIATVVAMLGSLAVEQPLAILCEDLHWVDDTTAKVIGRISVEISALRVLMIATTRPTADKPPEDLARFRTIQLEALPAPTAAQLVRSIARRAALSEEAVHRIVTRCEGVPLVLEEVTRSSVDAASKPPFGAADAPAVAAAPQALELVVQSRLARRPRLTPIVQAAAILGREFSIPVLERMVPEEHRGDIADTLDLLARDGLFAAPDSGAHDRAQFKHAMICEAVYNTLLGSDRKRLHSHAADTLMSVCNGTPDAAPDVLAEHLRNAHRFPESVRLRLAASADTVARGAYVEAEGHCEAGRDVLTKMEDGAERRMLEFKLLVQLGVALTGRHGYSAAEVETNYRKAQAVCGESAEAEMLYPIMRGLTALNLVRGKLAAGYELSLQAMALAERSKRVEFRIDAMSVHCYATMYYRRLDECRSWIERCVDLYRANAGGTLTYPVPNDPAVAALAIRPTVEWLMGDSHAAEEAIREGSDHAEQLGNDFNKAYMHAWIAGVRCTQRRYAKSIEHATIAVEIAQRNGYREWYVTGLLIGLVARAAQKPDPQALAQASETCEALAKEGVGLNASWYLWALARGFLMVGNSAVAKHLLARATLSADASGETRMNPELLMLQAELEPDAKVATQLLKSALEVADSQGAVANSLRAAATLVLRTGREGETASLANTTREILDGSGDFPPQRGWMKERLAALRRALSELPAVTQDA
jgi:class 3 adenylate cyclase